MANRIRRGYCEECGAVHSGRCLEEDIVAQGEAVESGEVCPTCGGPKEGHEEECRECQEADE